MKDEEFIISDTKKIRIVYVDDDKDFLQLTKLFLEELSNGLVTVHSLSNPEQIFSLLDTSNFDIIIADYQMPEMNGLDLLRQLKEKNYDIPFIIFTGRGREEVVIEALNLGADYYIKKGGDPQSQYSELYHVIQRVISHKEMEDNVRKSERKFRELANLLPEIVFELDKNMKISYINNYFFEEYGYSLEEVKQGMNALQVVVPENREVVTKTFNRLIDEKYEPPLEIAIMRKDGTCIPSLAFSSLIMEDDKPIGIRGIIVDISKLKQYETALLESEQRYITLFQENPIGIVTCNLEGNIEDVNKVALKFLGSPSEESTKAINLITFPLLKNAGISGNIVRCIKNKEQFSSELPYTSKWGKLTHYRYKMIPLMDKEEETTGVLLALEDITAYKQIEEELLKQREELSNFSNFMAHDLRNNLTVMEGYLQLHGEKSKIDITDKIQSKIKYLRKLLDRSLYLAERGEIIEKKDKVNLNIIVKDIVKLVIPESVEFAHDNLPTVSCDSEKLSQVFSNILENAVIHGNPSRIEIKTQVYDDKIEILIINDGQMIPKSEIEKIFKIGYSTRKDQKGQGIGLAIVKKIIEAHGWQINFQSVKGETLFKITIPQD